MPSPENLYFSAETKCPVCEGTGRSQDKAHTASGKQFYPACDECGATGYVGIRLNLVEMARAIKVGMERLP